MDNIDIIMNIWIIRILSMDYMLHQIYIYIYTLWLFTIAMENGPFIDGSPMKDGDFPWLC